MSERAEHHSAFPSWRAMVAFYRAKPRVLIATVALATLPNLIWVIDRLA